MDLDDITEEEYFGELKMMFKTAGWQIYCAELEELADNMNNIQDVQDEKDLWIKRGRLDQIGLALNFEDTIKRAEEESDE